MSTLISAIFSQLSDWLESALNSTFATWFASAIFGPFAKMCLDIGTNCYNKLIGVAIQLLMQSPDNWNGGSGWSVISTVNTTFIAIGASLVVIFWAIGIISLSVDERMNMRAEVMIKQLGKFVLAEFLVVDSINIISAFFSIVNGLINSFIPTAQSIYLSVPDDVNTFLDNPGLPDGLLCAIISLLFLVGSFAASASIVYFTYIRFFKVLLIIPYGSFASSYIAGGHAFSPGALSYYKYAISTVLEAVTMVLALKLSSAIISSDAINIVSNESGTNGTTVVEWILRALILMFVTLGAIKESSQITQKGIGM